MTQSPMQNSLLTIIITATVTTFLVFIGYTIGKNEQPENIEQVTEAQFYNQVLQYLEDIRNYNDIMINQADYYHSLQLENQSCVPSN